MDTPDDPNDTLPKSPVLYPAPEPAESDDRRDIWIPYGYTTGQERLAWNIGSRSTSPHLIAVGPSGSGLSTLLRTLTVGATLRGAEVWAVDPTGAVLSDLDTWPGVTKVASTPTEARELIDAAHGRMHDTYKRIRSREIHPHDVDHLVILIDLASILAAQLRHEWRVDMAGKGEVQPLWQLIELLGLSRTAGIRIALASNGTVVNEQFLAQAWDNLRTRISLGHLSPPAAMLMWHDNATGTEPIGEPGRGWATGPNSTPVPAQLLWTPSLDPDPLDRDTLSRAERDRIDQLRLAVPSR